MVGGVELLPTYFYGGIYNEERGNFRENSRV